ncbi:glyceraldehyde 3-phosphate dehydrogenase NAD-binding domain-containing protein [Streptomyces sp. NPDC057474]|uniref:glyceraldehyde 3-phosphate dehydrogenase NAD-binding domain-containing protein n=1 Tax=Streptomyces sp. NPDC057474 TaxID=3346144 RepID=UPI003682CB51
MPHTRVHHHDRTRRHQRYDSAFGSIGRDVRHGDSSLTVDGRRISATAERDPVALQWGDHGVDVVIESTGRFRDRDLALCT